ncbi:hypothetical protein B0T09DRAFT_370701 [Sordaria sp. MPI-SDFR-AT-0083]|nr:hypothetical protein B0T09DRAFT_370701 [Sordaria sp. MPI-SDFR-AT-0083]
MRLTRLASSLAPTELVSTYLPDGGHLIGTANDQHLEPFLQGLGSQGSAEPQTLGMSLMNARRPQAVRLNLTLARLSATGIAYPSSPRRLQASEPTIKLPTTLVSEMRQSPVIT